jgi:hypothetical protein
MNKLRLMGLAIQNLDSECEFGVRLDESGEPYALHKGGNALPSTSAINTEIARITSPETARDNRREEYPEIVEQFDKLYHDIDSGTVDKTGSFYTVLKAVKDKYPKG